MSARIRSVTPIRSVAQSGRVPALGAGCRGFKSLLSDHLRESDMIKKLSVFVLSTLLTFNIAWAAEATLSWTPPTQNEDGSPLTDLAGYNFYYGTATGVYDQGPINLPDPTATEYVVTGLANDTTYYFVATAYNTAGTESQYSGEATKTIGPLAPKAPTNLTVNPEDGTAYTYSISVDRLVMIPIGTVPGDTPCDTSMSMNGLYRVDRDSVNYVGSIQPPVVFADCV